MEVFISQYDLIQRTRESLFHYCEMITATDYAKELENFGGNSIRSLHSHVADCYRIWLGNRALGKSFSNIKPELINNVHDMRRVFKNTDALVEEFLNEFKGKWDVKVQVSFGNGTSKEFTALWLFTHTITHEFHHKGQIVKVGRQLGYIPPKTDLIR